MDINQSNGIPSVQPEERLTKRQRRELRKQERMQQNEKSGSRKKTLALVWWAIAILVVVALIWWAIASGSAGEPKTNGLDAMKKDTHNAFVGSPNASVVIREFSDFQCPACKAAQPVITDIIQSYGERIRFEYNHYPLVSIHKNALFAAEAAECANDQQQFWKLHDKFFDAQDEWKELDKKDAMAKFKAYAKDFGLNSETFDACVDSEEKRETVQQDINQGNAADVAATPTFFINDEKIEGVPGIQAFKSAIDSALEKARTAETNGNTNP